MPATQVILEFRDPTSDNAVRRLVAAINRLNARDGTAVISVPASVIGA